MPTPTMTLLAANNANSTLAGPISNVATTANLAAGSGALFPNPSANEYFTLTFIDQATGNNTEIVYVTSRSGDAVTMIRAQEGTTGQNWLAGDFANNFITSGTIELMVQPTELQVQPGNYGVDSGSANALAVNFPVTPSSMAAIVGAPLRIKKSGSANTGAATLAVNGYSPVSITYADGSAIGAGALPANGTFEVIFDGTAAVLQTAASSSGVSSSQLQQQPGNYGVDTGTANALSITLTPAPASYAAMVGMPVRILKGGSNNSAGCSLNVNGLGAVTITHGDGSSLASGELPANGVLSVVYSGVSFMLQSVGIPVAIPPATPSGTLAMFGGQAAPSGWLACDGTAYSTSTYPALFGAIGYAFGGGGASFSVPDFRGYFARGWDAGRGVDPARTFGSLQADDFQSHTHAFDLVDHSGAGTTAAFGANVSPFPSASTLPTGGTETRPKNIAVLYMIKI